MQKPNLTDIYISLLTERWKFSEARGYKHLAPTGPGPNLAARRFYLNGPTAERYSARSAGNNGDLSAAQVATSDATSPDINTASSNKPSER